jgi:hypothetical protein
MEGNPPFRDEAAKGWGTRKKFIEPAIVRDEEDAEKSLIAIFHRKTGAKAPFYLPPYSGA